MLGCAHAGTEYGRAGGVEPQGSSQGRFSHGFCYTLLLTGEWLHGTGKHGPSRNSEATLCIILWGEDVCCKGLSTRIVWPRYYIQSGKACMGTALQSAKGKGCILNQHLEGHNSSFKLCITEQ